MPTENINIESQVQSDITRAALQALITAGTVKKKIYHISDAVGGTLKIGVFSLTNSTTSFNAFNFTQAKFGKYFIVQDIFIPIVEGNGAVLSYNSFAVFPITGQANTVYIDLSTGDQYYWDGSAYEPLSGGNVYEPTLDDFPAIGETDTLYIATETGVMYLWNGTSEQYEPLNNTPYIPLAGTEVGSPVTGSIETTLGVEMFVENSAKAGVLWDDGQVNVFANSLDNSENTAIGVGSGVVGIGSNVLDFAGAVYNADYSANFSNRSLIDLETMKKRIWTKAGTPTTSDDSTQGYVVGSLIWDTTNSKMYRCTSNTASAASWEEVFKASSFENLTGCSVANGLQLSVGITRYLPMVFSGNLVNATNSSWVATKYAKGGVLSGFTVDTNSTQPNSALTFTLMKGTSKTSMADTAIVVTVPANAALGAFTSSDTLVVDDGDYLCWKVTQGGTGTSAVIEQTSCVLAH